MWTLCLWIVLIKMAVAQIRVVLPLLLVSSAPPMVRTRLSILDTATLSSRLTSSRMTRERPQERWMVEEREVGSEGGEWSKWMFCSTGKDLDNKEAAWVLPVPRGPTISRREGRVAAEREEICLEARCCPWMLERSIGVSTKELWWEHWRARREESARRRRTRRSRRPTKERRSLHSLASLLLLWLWADVWSFEERWGEGVRGLFDST